jgi:hypothetical protein
MNPEILNNIFNFMTEVQNKKRSPIIDMIDKLKYKLFIFTDAGDTRHYIDTKILSTCEQRQDFIFYYCLSGYITYNNKRRWSIMIFKEDLKILTENKFNMNTYINGVDMIFNKITNNKITKYDQKYYKDIIKYINENEIFKTINF